MGLIRKRLLALLLALSLLSVLPAAASAAGESGTGYRIEGEYDSAMNSFTVSIYIHHINALGGRIALGFNTDQLRVPDSPRYLGDVIRQGSRIELTGERKEASQLISQERGHLMFAWYPYGAPVEAEDGEYLVGTVRFQVQEGVTEEDFNSRTLYLYSVAGNYLEWDTSAWVRGSGLVDYSSCVPGHLSCDVEFEYPNSDKLPDEVRTVEILAKDSAGATLRGGEVQIENRVVAADSNGRAAFDLPDGHYTCMVSAPGYEAKTDDVTVSGGNVYRTIGLRSTQQLVDDVAAGVEIGFQGGDSAEYVTHDMIFPVEGEQNTKITWTTSDIKLVSVYGNIFRGKSDADVTVRATVSKDSRSASKSFAIHLTAQDTPVTPIEDQGGSGGQGNPDISEDPPIAPAPFTDVASVASWAGEAIDAMYAKGIIQGTSATTFSPGSPITRADFLTLLMRMMKPEGKNGAGFADVSADAYYYNAVLLAQGLGIAQGGSDGRFNPRGEITRQDMITLTYRALNAMGYEVSLENGAARMAAYADNADVSAYAVEAMQGMLASGYINGQGDYLAPRANTTRAEAAVFLYRIHQNILEGKSS